MRTFIIGSFLIIVTGMLTGCGSTTAAKSDPQAAAPSAKSADARTAVMQSGGADVLQLTLAPDIKYVAKDGKLHINAPQFELNFWLVKDAKTVDEAIERIPQEIKEEFKDFKETSTTALTVAGSPAKRLMGSGVEADDGDKGHADVIVFKVADGIFIACAHGEDLTSLAQQGLLTIVQTAHTP